MYTDLIDCEVCRLASMKDHWIKGASPFHLCKTCTKSLEGTLVPEPDSIKTVSHTIKKDLEFKIYSHVDKDKTLYRVDVSSLQLGGDYTSVKKAEEEIYELTRHILG